MDNISGKVNILLLKFSVKKWDVLNKFGAANLDGLAARFSWSEILDVILANDSYLTATIKKMYLDLLQREADPDGLINHVEVYRDRGWRSCIEGFVYSDEYWDKRDYGNPRAVLPALWRDLTNGEDPPDFEGLAAALEGGLMSRSEVIWALLSRPEVARRECNRLWRRLTGAPGPVPESVVLAFESKGREEAIRTICDSPEFALSAARNGPGRDQTAKAARVADKHIADGSSNPYKNRPSYTYWKSAVTEAGAQTDPVIGAPFSISRSDPIATAGSCFAQHLSKALAAQGYRYLVTEHYQPQPGVADENYGVYPARFGNIYTTRHLLQLFERAYGLRVPHIDYWHGEEGRFIDPFRPRIQERGFPSIESLLADRERHYRAVRQMFEQCRVFIFTLGLTETWISAVDGSAYPLAPGVVAGRPPEDGVEFHNLSVGEVSADLDRFLSLFAEVNPEAKVILTVSPVPLIATYEERHVLVSTIASKSILRAAADEICRRHERVTYFASFEIITGPQTGAKYYREDLREVSDEGVSFVMSVFGKHFLSSAPDEKPSGAGNPAPGPGEDLSAVELREEDLQKYSHFARIICDEELILR